MVATIIVVRLRPAVTVDTSVIVELLSSLRRRQTVELDEGLSERQLGVLKAILDTVAMRFFLKAGDRCNVSEISFTF